MNAIYKFLSSVLAVLLLNVSYGQHHRFRHISVDDGLSHNGVYCMTQDEKGFIWIGTESGLNRYDGSNIKIYQHDPKNINSLGSNDVNSLVAWKNFLYIGSPGGGLTKIDLKTNKISRYPIDAKGNGKINSPGIQSLQISPDGKIYVGTYDAGINIIDPSTDKVTYLRNDSLHPEILASNWIKSIAFDQSGNLWMSHPRTGVSRYNLKEKKWTLFTDTTSSIGKLNNNNVKAIYCDKKNRIWISTWSGGMNIYEVNSSKMFSNSSTKADPYFKPFMTDISNTYLRNQNSSDGKKYELLHKLRMVFSFSEDAFGNIWAATVEEGLFCFNTETGMLRQFKNNPSDPSTVCDNNLLSIFIDKSGLVWSGSLSAGINIFNPYTDRFGYYKADLENPLGLQNSQVWAIHTGRKTGKIFVAVTGYIYEFSPDNGTFKDYIVDKYGKTLLHPQALCQSLHEDKEGKIWIAINGSGIYVYDPAEKSLIQYDKPHVDALLHHTINDIDEDSKGNIWLGMSMHGLNKYDKNSGVFTSYPQDQGKGSISGYLINNLMMDHSDNLWIATDSGLNVLNTGTGKITTYTESNSKLSSNAVYALFQDSKKNIYIGTGAGLCRFDEKSKTFENLSSQYRFAENGVGGITVDQRGNLWIQPFKGIMCVDGKTYESHNYDFSDGLQSNEFPGNIIQTLSDGKIIFGGNKGLNVFHPDALITNEHAPGVVITDFLLRNVKQFFDKDASYLPAIELDYDHYFFTVELAALDFTNPSKNKFKYKLEGFNDEWVEIGGNKQITFVNLAPGTYTLYVLACNNDGVWSKAPAILKITITPPFWKTTWFYILCGLFILLVIYGYIKYREKKLQKEKAVLEEKVNLRTSELREEKEKVEEAHKEIRDSISYAKRLQDAILPPQKLIDQNLTDNFVLYKPKDIVAGDFYWAEKSGDWFFIAAADCTGHGVPGAMVSVVCSNALNRSVKEFGIVEPGKILDKTTDLVLETFSKNDTDVKDGMDISLLAINKTTKELFWSGANNPLWYTLNGEMMEIKADKQPIGKSDRRAPFTSHKLNYTDDGMIYLFTDGYADQFGGEKGKKFKYKPFFELLIRVSGESMDLQKTILDETLENWKGDIEQNDDICIIGIRL